MRSLVVGQAALWDLIAAVDTANPSHEVGRITDGPARMGTWLPGGAAPTVALAMARNGSDVALWHPIPDLENSELAVDLASAGVDLSRCSAKGPAARCIVVRNGEEALMWSSAAPPNSAPADLDLRGIEHVVLCPAWGEWARLLLVLTERIGLPRSLIGMLPSEALGLSWNTVVVNSAQLADIDPGRIEAKVLVITEGRRGSRIRSDGEWSSIPAKRATVIDPTGAGDVYGGTFLSEVLKGRDLSTAGRIASEAAAACCGQWGAQTSLLPQPRRGSTDAISRSKGALWGLACGDAFGMPNAFLPASLKLRVLGVVTELVAAPSESPYHMGYVAGRITDDTEQALALTRAIKRSDGRVSPEVVAEELSRWLDQVGGPTSKAVGPSTKAGLTAWRVGVNVRETGIKGTSNGGAMRIAPLGVLAGLAEWPLEQLLDNVRDACMPTHHTAVAISAAAAVAGSVHAGVMGTDWDDVLNQGIVAARLAKDRAPWSYAPDVSRRIDAAIRLADTRTGDRFLRDVSEIVGAGEPASEAVPAAFAISARVLGDPAHAIRLAGNLEGDSDTIAAMAGAICGSWAGADAIPKGWRDRVALVNDLDVDGWAEDIAAAAAEATPGAIR
jgi:ADP-ribosylglycohydrolase/sugar/nucleoside kinase (ribokinase family)